MHERGHSKSANSAGNRIRKAMYAGTKMYDYFWQYDTPETTVMEGELWKKCKGYYNIKVSNKGRVAYGINTHRTVSYGLTGTQNTRFVLEPRTKRKTNVHRLVAQEFIPGWDPSLYVLHRDGDKTNNSVENLMLTKARYKRKRGTEN